MIQITRFSSNGIIKTSYARPSLCHDSSMVFRKDLSDRNLTGFLRPQQFCLLGKPCPVMHDPVGRAGPHPVLFGGSIRIVSAPGSASIEEQ
jgi:hypothetical protein